MSRTGSSTSKEAISPQLLVASSDERQYVLFTIAKTSLEEGAVAILQELGRPMPSGMLMCGVDLWLTHNNRPKLFSGPSAEEGLVEAVNRNIESVNPPTFTFSRGRIGLRCWEAAQQAAQQDPSSPVKRQRSLPASCPSSRLALMVQDLKSNLGEEGCDHEWVGQVQMLIAYQKLSASEKLLAGDELQDVMNVLGSMASKVDRAEVSHAAKKTYRELLQILSDEAYAIT